MVQERVEADSPFTTQRCYPFLMPKGKYSQAHTHSGHRPYLTSVRKDASSHLVVSLIRLKSPSHIRGISPESPCSGKEGGQQLSLETKATDGWICVDCWRGRRLKGLHATPKPTTQCPSHTISPRNCFLLSEIRELSFLISTRWDYGTMWLAAVNQLNQGMQTNIRKQEGLQLQNKC